MRLALFAALAFPLAADATPGPWTLGQDDLDVRLGATYGRWQAFATGGKDRGIFTQDESVTRTSFYANGSYGLLKNVELDLGLTYASSAMSKSDDRCSDERIGADKCETTRGLAPVAARLKIRLLDELSGAPFTLSVGPDLRFGDHTRPYAHRMTNIGLGQTDAAAFLAAGRSGGLFSGSYGLYLEGMYRYRFALTFLDGVKAPGDEAGGRLEMVYYPTSPVAVGLTVHGYHMLRGADWGEIEPKVGNDDLFVALQTAELKVGTQVIVRSLANMSFYLYADRTLWARNTAADDLTVGAAIGTFRPSKYVE